MEKQVLVKEIRNSERARYIDVQYKVERKGFKAGEIRATLEVYGELLPETDWISEGDVILAFWRSKGPESGAGGVFEGALPQELKPSSKRRPKSA